MRPGATLLIMEMLVVDDDARHMAKLLDMEILDVTNEGRQRRADEFRGLLESSGFRMQRVVALSSPNSIVEVDRELIRRVVKRRGMSRRPPSRCSES